MKIVKFNATAIKVPLPRPVKGSTYQYTHVQAVTLEVETDEGITGCSYIADAFDHAGAMVQLIQGPISDHLVGEDPLATARCWEKLRVVCRTVHRRGRDDGLHAQGLVDMALWDIVGKVAKLPLSKLWGGYCESRPVIAIGGYYVDGKKPEAYAHDAHELVERGFAGIKLKVGGLSIEEDVRRVKAVREAGGESFLLAVDSNQAWSVSEAVEFAQRTADYDLLWMEEPVHWENDRTWLAQLRAKINVPLCAGQSEVSVNGCKELLEAGAIDICNFSSTYGGGVTPWLQAAGLAKVFGAQLAFTGEPQQAIHYMTAFEHGTVIEAFHPDRDPVFYEIVMPPSGIHDGYLAVSDAPGWGYDIPADYLNAHRVT